MHRDIRLLDCTPMDILGTLLCPILVGRDEVLGLAAERLRETASGQGRTLLLSGEAGLGKTRILGAISREATAAGFVTVQTSLAPQDQEVPAASILDLARHMVAVPRLADAGASLLEFRAKASTEAREPIGRRFLVKDIVQRLVDAFDRPALLCFDDLHWADELSLDIIGELALAARASQLMVVGAYRG